VGDKRYYVFQLWDPNGDTFNYIGTRTTGRDAGHYALVGPDWKGTLPEGIKRIDTPYNSFAIWGRIGVSGPGDLKNALAIEDALCLTPLSQFGESEKPVAPDISFSENRIGHFQAPTDFPKGLEFYYELARAIKFSPPKPGQDDVIAESLSTIEFTNDNTKFNYSALNDVQIKGLKKAYQFAQSVMDVNAQTAGSETNGWRWSPKSGIPGKDYLWRAAFAKWYTGGVGPKEAIYMMAGSDEKKQALAGGENYRIHFNKGELPNVQAFWSISMYHSSDGSFVANPIKRYSIGDRTEGLTINKDGSLDIYMQHSEPTTTVGKANWLPSPEQEFYLILRMYGPDDSLQKGTWKPPVVKALQ